MSTPSSPLGSHDLTDVVGIDLETTISAFEGDVTQLDPHLGIRIARIWRETLQQSDWTNAHALADQWARLEDTLAVDEIDHAELADSLLDLAEGHRIAAAETDDERFTTTFERLAATLAAAAEGLGGRDVEAHTSRPGDDEGA